MRRRTFLQIAGLSTLSLSLGAAHVTLNPKPIDLQIAPGMDRERAERLARNPHKSRWCHLYLLQKDNTFTNPLVTESKVGKNFLIWSSSFTGIGKWPHGLALADDEHRWVMTGYFGLPTHIVPNDVLNFTYRLQVS